PGSGGWPRHQSLSARGGQYAHCSGGSACATGKRSMSARVALVTGGARGIGRAIVQTLVADGWITAFTYRSGGDEARRVEEAHGGQARGFELDLRDRARPDALVREITESLGTIEGLVNNAGIRHEGLLAMTCDDDWDSLVEVNQAG